MSKLQNAFNLSNQGYSDLKKAIFACVISNLALMIPFGLTINIIIEIIKPLLGEEISWNKIWVMFFIGVIGLFLIYLANKNDYKKTYVASYMEGEKTRIGIAEHVRKLPMSYFRAKDLSELTTNIMQDVATTEHVLSHVIPQVIANCISIVVICLMLSIFNWQMSLAVFISVPLAFGIIFFSRKIYTKLHRKHAKLKLDASAQVQEYLEGIKIIIASNMSGEKFRKLDETIKRMKEEAIKMEIGTGVFVLGAQVILQAGIGLTVLVGSILFSNNQINLITFLMFVLIVVRIYGPLLTELTLLPELLYHQISIKRIRDLLNIKPMSGKEDVVFNNHDIIFEDVSFTYKDENKKVLKDINITIPQKKITALVGPSGSGKSTLSSLIARFWDVSSGHISIGGHDLRDIEPETLMNEISFVFQDVILFNDTVYNNIKIGNSNATFEDIEKVAKLSRCDEFIAKLPEKYDTILGENGATLSGGERQRLSIARALLKDAPIVLLDEATASLDPENETLIQEAISNLIVDKTVIVIAHKLRSIENVDLIIVLDKGEIIEFGKHDTLLKESELYRNLYNIQNENDNWQIKD